MIFEIDRQGKELRSVICAERKTIEKPEELLLKVDVEINQQRLEIHALKVEQWSMDEKLKKIERTNARIGK